jgi:hypothetical protein
LNAASPSLKEELLSGAVRAVSEDGKITIEEAELLRGIGDILGCPIPPLAVEPINPGAAKAGT